MKNSATAGLAIVVFTTVAVFGAAPASAEVNPAPSSVSITAFVDEAFSATIPVTLAGGTWNWASGSSYWFRDDPECPSGFGSVAPGGLTFADKNLWFYPGVEPTGIVVSGTAIADDAVGGPAGDGVYPVCVLVKDDDAGNAYFGLTVTVMDRPIAPPATDPTLATTGVEISLALGLGIGALLLAGVGAVVVGAGALGASRRRTASN
jgi:hypothetical protein